MSSTDERDQDWELAVVGPLDPAAGDAAPARGSARYTAILEAAMSRSSTASPTDVRPDHQVDEPARSGSRTAPPRRASRRRTWVASGATAAAAAAAVLALGVLGPGGLGDPGTPPGASSATSGPSTSGGAPEVLSASQLVLTAARTTARVGSLRATVTVTEQGETSTTSARFAGADAVIDDVDGLGRPLTHTIIGTTVYTTQDGVTTVEQAAAEDLNVPFATSAADVINAAVMEGGAREVGTQDVRGTSATHYRLDLTDPTRAALAALGPQRLAWFDLEDPDLASAIDVWVADGLIRRIDVADARGPGTSVSTEFYDFDADLAITAPPLS